MIDYDALARFLVEIGCPPNRCNEMAKYLDKRARQLMELRGESYESAMKHLAALMKQGWAAQRAEKKGHADGSKAKRNKTVD